MRFQEQNYFPLIIKTNRLIREIEKNDFKSIFNDSLI
jgi:hypothetical protein